MNKLNRLLLPESIPNSIWNNGTVCFSAQLSEAYKSVLEENGMLTEALDAISKGDIGGESAKEARDHFLRNFSGSCGRISLALLDPKNDLNDCSNLFINAFSAGSLGMLDVPCGTGAAAATTLSIIAELREKSVIPRQPLEVFLVSGDLSEEARRIAKQINDIIKPKLESQAIFLNDKFVSWNVLDKQNTRDLLDTWINHCAG